MYFFKKNAKLLGVVTAIKGAFGTKLMLDDVVLDDVVTAQKNPVTGVISFSGRINAEIIKGKIGRVPLKVSGIGNSIMYAATPWIAHACDQSGGLFEYVGLYGVPGDNTAGMLTRKDQVPASAHIVFIMECANDGAGNVSNTNHIANMRGLIEFYLGRGQLPVICIPPARSDNATNKDRTFKLGMCDYFLSVEYEIPCYDPWRIFVDETTGGLTAASGTTDNLHPGSVGHYLAGVELLKQMLGQSHTQMLSVTDYKYDGVALLSNSMMSAGWGNYGVGGTASVVADANIPGSWRQVTGNGMGQFVVGENALTGFQAGDELLISFRAKCGGGAAGSSSCGALSAPSYVGVGKSRYLQGQYDGIISGYGVVPAGTTYLACTSYVQDGTDGKTTSIAQFQIYNKTAILNR